MSNLLFSSISSLTYFVRVKLRSSASINVYMSSSIVEQFVPFKIRSNSSSYSSRVSSGIMHSILSRDGPQFVRILAYCEV